MELPSERALVLVGNVYLHNALNRIAPSAVHRWSYGTLKCYPQGEEMAGTVEAVTSPDGKLSGFA